MTDPSGLEKLLYPGQSRPPNPQIPPYLAPIIDNPGTLEYHQLELLDSGARSCGVVADFVRTGLGRTGRPTDAAAQDMKGFASAGPLSGLVDSWHSNGRSLADHIDSIGPRLSRTAAAYRQAEDKIRGTINKVWKVED
ncbi:WXG100 family type VII secretion target [Actinomadura litoris]|uniref:WXG100 family type VII secretion target n=1 Tax=Actinomadura litoris TaxID=2678616 RepID=UPI001FA76612|nr:hypothetical protein [Actinomadura litoris]